MNRSADDLLRQVTTVARQDERVRAAVLSGSRARACAKTDPFQDVDVTFYVRDLPSFTRDHAWIDQFGERMILQLPDSMGRVPYRPGRPFMYLMQFMDGHRLDLGLIPTHLLDARPPESLSRVLLDKDGLLPDLPAANESDYFPVRPKKKEFQNSGNEFFWLAPYVAKGLWRGQLAYAKFHLDTLMRGELMKMLNWAFGYRTAFNRNPGKFGENFAGVLPDEWLTTLQDTYAGKDDQDNWNALLSMTLLFRWAAQEVAHAGQFPYPAQDDDRVTSY